MAKAIKNVIADNLRSPKPGVVGWLLTNKLFQKQNYPLQKIAVELCNIQPHHKVLEVGFGPGYGLIEAYRKIQYGDGKISGIDNSMYMVEVACKKCCRMISEGKINITYGTVENLPFNTDSFDSVFHVNSFYYWPNLRRSLQEIYRVTKPGGQLVTTLQLKSLIKYRKKGLLKYGRVDPVRYMDMLERTGFKNVHIEYLRNTKTSFQVIRGNILDKPAHDTELQLLLDSEYPGGHY